MKDMRARYEASIMFPRSNNSSVHGNLLHPRGYASSCSSSGACYFRKASSNNGLVCKAGITRSLVALGPLVKGQTQGLSTEDLSKYIKSMWGL